MNVIIPLLAVTALLVIILIILLVIPPKARRKRSFVKDDLKKIKAKITEEDEDID